MNIANRRFVYPVLSVDTDDYKTSVFNVEYKNNMDGVNSLKLTFDIEMDCPELEEMIANGQAEYVIHLECSTTAYREIIPGVSKHIEHTISIERINGTLNCVAFIILKKSIDNYSCKDWVDDYAGITFSLVVGSILAYQNLEELDITKEYEEFINSKSIFSIYRKVTDEDKPAEINLESAKIKIGLTSKYYDIYSMYSGKIEIQPLLFAMIIFPALIYVFEELKQDGGEDEYHHREWFIALNRAYEKRGNSLMDEVQNADKTSYQLAQEAMNLPINKALDIIPTIFNSYEED